MGRVKSNAGQLDRQIVIQQNTPTRDSVGGQVDNWTTHATVWAAIEPIKGRRFLSADQQVGETTHRFRIRYLPTLTKAMRISYDGRIFVIDSVVDEDEQNRWNIILAVEDD